MNSQKVGHVSEIILLILLLGGGKAIWAQPNPKEGEKIFQKLGCVVCHSSKAEALGPTLKGIYGKKVELVGGKTVTVDDSFIKEHVLNPRTSDVNGYPPIMPAFKDKVSEKELDDLVAYVKSLSDEHKKESTGETQKSPPEKNK